MNRSFINGLLGFAVFLGYSVDQIAFPVASKCVSVQPNGQQYSFKTANKAVLASKTEAGTYAVHVSGGELRPMFVNIPINASAYCEPAE
ncbi:MAG: hypothetical protein V4534_06320 [Myxococcota bacterium]